MAEYVSDADEPEYVEDFGFFHSAAYVFETAQIATELRILPQAGGWDDQSAEWCDDFFTWLKLKHYAESEKQPRERKDPPDDLKDLYAPDAADEWSNYTRDE
jgi:hypothetical protein